MKLGMIHYNTPGDTLKEFLDYASGAGFHYLELGHRDAWPQGDDAPEKQAERVRAMLAARNLATWAYQAGNDFIVLKADGLAGEVGRMRRSAGLAKILGTDLLRIDAGWPRETDREQEWLPAVVEGMQRCVEWAESLERPVRAGQPRYHHEPGGVPARGAGPGELPAPRPEPGYDELPLVRSRPRNHRSLLRDGGAAGVPRALEGRARLSRGLRGRRAGRRRDPPRARGVVPAEGRLQWRVVCGVRGTTRRIGGRLPPLPGLDEGPYLGRRESRVTTGVEGIARPVSRHERTEVIQMKRLSAYVARFLPVVTALAVLSLLVCTAADRRGARARLSRHQEDSDRW